jgi:cytoskeletal protein CcmA (bactofilin family)
MTLSTLNRPLPTGIVGLTQGVRALRQEQREAAPSGTLLVGRAIKVRGQIESCQNLVVEGRVEAGIAAKSLTVLKGGAFKGTAEVDKADIAGDFEGTLTVRGRLTIKSSGTATGQISYQDIAIESGGKIAGDVGVGAEAQTQDGTRAAVPAKRPAGHVA